jgi:hypothetical protein
VKPLNGFLRWGVVRKASRAAAFRPPSRGLRTETGLDERVLAGAARPVPASTRSLIDDRSSRFGPAAKLLATNPRFISRRDGPSQYALYANVSAKERDRGLFENGH